jgi:adenylate kinase
MGVQGAGKGTQAAYLCQKYNLLHISTGDLFRAMRTRTDALAQRIIATINSGILVDDAATNDVLRDRLEQGDVKNYNGVLLDGYPRNEAQAQWLTAYLESNGKQVDAVLLLELDLYTAFKRSFGRVTSPDGKQAFNIYSNKGAAVWSFEKDPDKKFPPRLVATLSDGTELTRRVDDADAFAVIGRIEKFLDETRPVLPYYEGLGLVRKVDADQSIETVSAQFAAIIDGLNNK